MLIRYASLIFLFWSPASFAQIQIAAQALVITDKVVLSDIADLTGVESGLKSQLENILIYKNIKPGQEIELEALQISQTLRKAMSEAGIVGRMRPLYRLPKKLSVRRGLPLSKNSLAQRLVDDLMKQCETCRFEIADLNANLIKSYQACEDWGWNAGQVTTKPNQVIPLQINCDKPASINIPVTIKIFRKGAVADNIIRVQTEIEKDQVREDWIDVSFSREPIATPTEVIGRKLIRRVPQNEAITASDLVKEFQVKRGQLIKVLLGEGPMVIQSIALAEQDGVTGDYIRLKNPNTGKLLAGRVEGQGLVRIQ